MFALAEYQENEAARIISDRLQVREEYKQFCREFRSNQFYRIPKWLYDHCWDIRNHVDEMVLPDTLQYHPLTEALQVRRQERVDGWFGSEYEKSLGI